MINIEKKTIHPRFPEINPTINPPITEISHALENMVIIYQLDPDEKRL